MIIYTTDGSMRNFLTAVFDAYNKNAVIADENYIQLSIDSDVIKTDTDEVKAERVKKRLNDIDIYALGDVDLVLRSGDSLKEQTAFEYIKLLIEERRPIRKMLHHPTVIQVTDITAKVIGEAHNMKGFLRFIETESGALYAPYSPDNDITDLIAPHFAARLGATNFVIHDIKRKKAALYNGCEWFMANAGEAGIYLSEYERAFEVLWKTYYNSVNLTERPHEKQMKGYMPVRYWKFMPEKKG